MAQPFDEARLQPKGNPFPVQSGVDFSATAPLMGASASAEGTLAYLAGNLRERRLTWLDRTGKILGTMGPVGNYHSVAISPDGNSAIATATGTLWLYDMARSTERRLTAPESVYAESFWEPGGSRLWMRMRGPEGQGLYRKNVRNDSIELMEKEKAGKIDFFTDVSRDGRFAVYTETHPKTRSDIWYVPVENGKPSGKPVQLLGTEAREWRGQFSPNGKWLAYESDETGVSQVYIRPFPMGSELWKVSAASGAEPRWSADGRELYFIIPDRRRTPLMAVPIEPDGRGGLRVGTARPLFETRIWESADVSMYSPHPDKQRFLVSVLAEVDPPTVNIVTNWQKALADAAEKR